jgi:CubicO group peptidase (beta-lactamase class C family)
MSASENRAANPLRSRVAAVLFAFGLAATSPGIAIAKDPPRAAEVATALGRRIDEAVQRSTGGGFWGTVLVARGGQIELSKGYGFADYGVRRNAPDTLFEIASTSKQVTATAILRLEQQKRLTTSDPIDKYLKDAPPDKHAITIDHLLHHTAGLDPELGASYAYTGTRAEYVQAMLERPLANEPGTKFAYSNVGYALLAAIVEVATGGSFEDYVRRELFATAGLTDTGFIKDERLMKSDRITTRLCDDCALSWTAADWFWGWSGAAWEAS